MGAKNLVMLKTQIDSINLCFANDFVYENVLWALASVWVFFCNYVLYSLGLILRYILRFQAEDRKNGHLVPHALVDQSKKNQFEDSEIDEFTEELANLLFPTFENFHVASEERAEETDCSVLMEIDYDIQHDAKKLEGETKCSVLKEKDIDMNEDVNKREAELEESSFMETVSYNHEDIKKTGENETESSVSIEDDSNFQQDNMKKVIEEKTEEPFVVDIDSAVASGLVEEPEALTFTFQKNYVATNVSDNTSFISRNIAENEFAEHNLEGGLAGQEKEEHSVQEQRTSTSDSTSDGMFLTNGFGGSNSSDDDHVLYDNLFPSDLGSESSCSNIADDSLSNKMLSSYHSCEGYESESAGKIKDDKVEDSEETKFSCKSEFSQSLNFHHDEEKDEKDFSYHGEEAYRDSLGKSKETTWEDNLNEWDSDEKEEDEDDFEWEHDEVVDQLRMELKNARQGGLATILEDEEDEETESPKVVEDLKPPKIEEKIEYKDHIVEIQKVYRSYAEKIRKLDVLNYQTMHAIGLLELKDPIKLMLMPKSTVQGAKPLNLWSRKASKHISEPFLKFVHELHRDLELVYVGQVCLSWEILCWQHKKVQELKQYDSQWPRRYNLVAGEFQIFQVLMQRFLEDEPFQGPRIQNYVKNRFVIRNLLQVPAIKDDNTKNKKIIKWGEEDAIDGEMLAQIIKKSMRVFWEFVRADKDYGNVIPKFSHQTGTEVKDPEISDLLGNVRTQLQKKERKLKDIVRSGNCIVKMFQKQHEDQIQLDHEQLLAQVGLRLVSRVIHMKNLRKDHLLWCYENLNRTKFMGKKIQVEPSFLLFPC